MLPDPAFLYPSKKHHMALTMLEYGLMNQVSFSVITGGIGTGKTTMIRYLLTKLDDDISVGLITNTHRSFGVLLQWIMQAFDLEFKGKDQVEMYHDFCDFLIEQYALNRRTVLIIDEAQNMNEDTLEELRMISNINAEKDQILQIIMVGQTELRDLLSRPGLAQFAQRISIDYTLESLDKDETCGYIRHRLSVAGGNPKLFTSAACNTVFRYSGGIPRLINLLCDTALVYGYAEQMTRIGSELMEEVAHDKQKGGLFPSPQQEPVPNVAEQNEPEPLNPVYTKEQQNAAPVDSDSKTNATENTKSKQHRKQKKKLRIAVAADSKSQRLQLRGLLERCGMDVVAIMPLSDQVTLMESRGLQFCEEMPRYKKILNQLDKDCADVLLIDLGEIVAQIPEYREFLLDDLMKKCKIPILFNDSYRKADKNTQKGTTFVIEDIENNLTLRLTSLMKKKSRKTHKPVIIDLPLRRTLQ